MTAATPPEAGNTPAEADSTAWFALSPEDALKKQGVDQAQGLAAADVDSRRAKYGPNTFTAAKKATKAEIFLRQYADPMQIVLLGAGVICLFLPDQQLTGVMLIFLTLFNALMGMNQEGKATSAARRHAETATSSTSPWISWSRATSSTCRLVTWCPRMRASSKPPPWRSTNRP
jgi:magnesium-transporting ATPase (P-type)